jgi:lipid-A-disaccharide synthase
MNTLYSGLNGEIFIFAGERSGDLHGSHLARALKKQAPNLILSGVPGPKMRLEGVKPILKMEQFEVMGFTDVILALPRLIPSFYKLRNHIIKHKPAAVILIDYPGFNLRMAKALRQSAYQGKIIQYVSPSVWAWGKERIETMSKTLDLLLTIYPFEAEYFIDKPLKVSYVGNPLCEYIRRYAYDEKWKEKLKIPETDRLIAIFTGSRISEIQHNLPMVLEAIARYKLKYPDALFAFSTTHPAVVNELNRLKISPTLQDAIFQVPQEFTYELMRDSRSALAKSGTVTLELALHSRPTVVIYKVSPLTRLYAKFLLKLQMPYYCIVNILSNQIIYPELIEKGLNAENIFLWLEKIDNQADLRYTIAQACSALIKTLSNNDSSAAAADSILHTLTC